MDPAVAALDFAKAGAIIANMIESYLAAGATPLNVEGAEHAEREDCRSSFGTASLHLHSPVNDGTSASQSGEHRASVQSSEPSEVARLDSGADPDSRRGSRTIRPTDDQARRLQDPCERRRDGASRRDLLSGVIASGARIGIDCWNYAPLPRPWCSMATVATTRPISTTASSSA